MPIKSAGAAPSKTVVERLDLILLHLERMDRRDRLRTWGGFFKGIISLIPVLVLVWSVWYFFEHGDELLQKISEQAAKQAAAVTQKSADSVLQQFDNLLVR